MAITTTTAIKVLQDMKEDEIYKFPLKQNQALCKAISALKLLDSLHQYNKSNEWAIQEEEEDENES